MMGKIKTSLATRLLDLILQNHKKGEYIYSLKEAAACDDAINEALQVADASEIRRIERNIGEAHVDMFYDAADAAAVGLEFSSNMKHAVFLEYVERNIRAEMIAHSGCATATHAPKA